MKKLVILFADWGPLLIAVLAVFLSGYSLGRGCAPKIRITGPGLILREGTTIDFGRVRVEWWNTTNQIQAE